MSVHRRVAMIQRRQQEQGRGQVKQDLGAHRIRTSIVALYSSKAETRAVTSSCQSPATLSSAQVREPIHGRALGEWKPYAAQLTGLRHALG